MFWTGIWVGVGLVTMRVSSWRGCWRVREVVSFFLFFFWNLPFPFDCVGSNARSSWISLEIDHTHSSLFQPSFVVDHHNKSHARRICYRGARTLKFHGLTNDFDTELSPVASDRESESIPLSRFRIMLEWLRTSHRMMHTSPTMAKRSKWRWKSPIDALIPDLLRSWSGISTTWWTTSWNRWKN